MTTAAFEHKVASGETLVADVSLCALSDAVDADVACARATELPARPPEWVDLLPTGAVEARDGRSWTVADPYAVVAASRERAGPTDMAIDYEHQAYTSSGEAPAAGWIKELRVSHGMIQGRAQWTARAAERIRAREYRYLSPVFHFDDSGTVKRILGAGLTNNPALDLPALARTQESAMNKEQLAKLREALGLAKDATVEAVLAAVAVAASGAAALAKVAAKVGLAGDAKADDVVAAAGTAADRADGLARTAERLGLAKDAEPDAVVAAARQAPDSPGDYVPRAEFDRVSTALTTLQNETAEANAAAAVDTAVEAGKVSPAQRDWALGYARSDADGFARYVEAAPVIVAPGRTGRGSLPTNADDALTDDERAMCRTLGVSEESFLAARKADMEQVAA